MKGKISIAQACILLRINVNTQKVLIKKYSDYEERTLLQWKKIIKGENIKIEEVDENK